MNKHELWIHALRFIYPVMLSIGLTACHKEMSPLISGVLEYPAKNGGFAQKDISAEQLKQLSVWLEKHSDDWSGCYATPPGPLFSIILKHANGQSSSLMLLSYGGTLKASYLDGSNKSDQPCAFLTVSEQEINGLRAMLFLEDKP